ncbi:uncharacterized protein ATC70_000277 [Mucor velutinosus]|uniref:DUF3020 domain-containing protein n=1 Tax=Mucor velutinosus TaxID=708070 RepID=A0AAN7HNF0_9FUNG|nr:hypothetical protein ATC70_000277 [Mucor velutinosus]
MDQQQQQASSPAIDTTLDVQEPASKRARLSTPESSHASSELNNTTTTEKIASPTTATTNDLTSSTTLGHADLPNTSSTIEQQQQDLDAFNQLQQLSEAHSQLAQVAAAAGLSGDNNFQFLTNFENSIAASVMAAAAAASNNATTAGSSTAGSGANSPDTTATATTTTTATNTGAATPNLQSISPNLPSQEVSDHQQQQQLNSLNELPTEILKRELMNQKVRADNRERKKRWRQQNEERNKDNDLRCRVNKRAHKLFGKEDSEHKKKWIDEEFLKRQQKRKDKERRKGLVDDSLGGHHHNHHHHSADGQLNAAAAAAAANGALDLAALAQHLQPQPSLSTLTDANYLTLLCNNLGIPAAARSIIGTHNAAAAAAAAAQQQTDESHQQQTLSNASAGTSSLHDTDIIKQEPQTTGNLGQQEEDDKNLQSFPFQLLELLQQLQQYQPQQTPPTHTESTTTTTTTTTTATHTPTLTAITDQHHGMAADTAPSDNTDFQLQQQFNAAMSDRPEDKLAALLASTLQAAATAASQGMKDEHDANQPQSSTSAETSQHTTVNQQEGEQQQQQLQLNNNAEFPMDAVLTLMQLNAGWRH